MVRNTIVRFQRRLLYLNEIPREWRSFKNNARGDGLELGHWAKASTDPAEGTSQ